MLWSTSVKVILESKIHEPEVRNGHPFAVGLIFHNHGLEVAVKAEVRSTSAEGLGLHRHFGHAIVFTHNMPKLNYRKHQNTTYCIYSLKSVSPFANISHPQIG